MPTIRDTPIMKHPVDGGLHNEKQQPDGTEIGTPGTCGSTALILLQVMAEAIGTLVHTAMKIRGLKRVTSQAGNDRVGVRIPHINTTTGEAGTTADGPHTTSNGPHMTPLMNDTGKWNPKKRKKTKTPGKPNTKRMKTL